VRELIEITLVKNPGMRYRSGGLFADAVAAVRSGRRPPRPNQAPSLGRATPAAVPSAAQARAAADLTVRTPTAAARPRQPTGSHRPPARPRSTFSSGQRALLWAAGVLGALAIIIAILIVLNYQDDKNKPPPPTTTVLETVPAPPSPTAMPDWTEQGGVRHGLEESGATRHNAIASPAKVQATRSAPEQISQ
jgi:eukaryotic-like serine/threonine-protein kinase